MYTHCTHTHTHITPGSQGNGGPEPKVLVEHVRKGTQHPVQNNGLSMWTCRVTTPCGVGFKPIASACEQLYFSPGRTEFKTMASACEQVYFPLLGLGSKLWPQHMNKYISPWRGWVQNYGLSIWTSIFPPIRAGFKTMASSCEQVYFPLVGLGSKLWPQHMNKYISPWRGWVQNHGLSMWTYIPLVGLGSKLWPQHVNKYISPLVGPGLKLWPQYVNKYIFPVGLGSKLWP